MKHVKLLTLLWVVLISCTLVGCWKDKNNEWDFIIEDITWQNDAVINYNDTLVDLTSKCVEAEDEVWSSYGDNLAIDDTTIAINNLIKECSNAKEEINKLWGREWDNSLKDWVIAVIEKEINYYTKFNELLPYLKKDSLTEEESTSYNAIYAEVETLNKELDEANENLSGTQKQFSVNHWFELEEVTE